MFDLREHKDLIRRLVSEANQNDPNWGVVGQTPQQERGLHLLGLPRYCDEAELSFFNQSREADGRCWVEARNQHGWDT